MIRILAIIERDLRRYRRSKALIAMSLTMPLMQLVILGYAFGGKVRHLQLGVIDQDHGVPALKLQEMFQAVSANAQTFTASPYFDTSAAMQDLRDGRINALLTIPPDFSRNVLAGASPRIALVSDNTDSFSSSALQASLQSIVGAYNKEQKPDRGSNRLSADVSLAAVEVYPYVPYIQYLLPGTITLSIFVSAMIGGGIIFIDDKARGLHEGYLVTPVTKFELIMGFNTAGVLKAVLSGIILVIIGSLIAGIPNPFNVFRLAKLFLMVVATALALISMMFLLVVRMNDPLMPRTLFGVLNTLLYFPSGAVYPVNAFPAWMRGLSHIDPFSYAVDGFKCLLLKDTGIGAITFDLAFLFAFSAVALGLATHLFRRTL